jgi:hypothetical protein
MLLFAYTSLLFYPVIILQLRLQPQTNCPIHVDAALVGAPGGALEGPVGEPTCAYQRLN